MEPSNKLMRTPSRSLNGRSKRYISIATDVDRSVEMEYTDAIMMLKQKSNAKFNETVEVHARLNLNTKYNDQQLRTSITLPQGSGNLVRVAAIVQPEKVSEAELAGADVFGSEDLIERIAAGFLDFDKLLATPDMMPKIARLGRLLGPKCLMPNPKTGTVTSRIDDAIADYKAGKLEFRADKAGIVHVAIGKADFEPERLIENFKAVIDAIEANKPPGAKGIYWKSLFIATTMGPGFRINISKIKGSKLE